MPSQASCPPLDSHVTFIVIYIYQRRSHMKSTALATIILAFFFNSAYAAEAAPGTEGTEATAEAPETEVEVAPAGSEASMPISSVENFCFFAGIPPSDMKYTVIRKLKVGKGTYGSVKDILPRFADNAQKAGADAIIRYTGSQRFGFFPWRMVRPVVRGVAVKWSDGSKRDCAAMGGATLKTILATDRPPSQ